MEGAARQRHDALSFLIMVLGHEPTDTHMEQLEILVQAFEKFVERNAKYRDLWRLGGPADSAEHLKSKAMRVYQLSRGDIDYALSEIDTRDDAIDIINYAAFYLRNVDSASLTSEEIDALGCEVRERRWPGGPWACTWEGDNCPVHGEGNSD